MNETGSAVDLSGLVDGLEEALHLVGMLVRVTRVDLDRLEALPASDAHHDAVPLMHRMLGALCVFERTPNFAQIRDVVEVMKASDVERFMAQLPMYRQRLLGFVEGLEQTLHQAAHDRSARDGELSE